MYFRSPDLPSSCEISSSALPAAASTAADGWLAHTAPDSTNHKLHTHSPFGHRLLQGKNAVYSDKSKWPCPYYTLKVQHAVQLEIHPASTVGGWTASPDPELIFPRAYSIHFHILLLWVNIKFPNNSDEDLGQPDSSLTTEPWRVACNTRSEIRRSTKGPCYRSQSEPGSNIRSK